MAFKQIFGGASHSDEIGAQFDFGWVGTRKKWKESAWPWRHESLCCTLRPKSYSPPMNVTINQPKPHNLREQVIQQISAMPESDVAQVYELLLLAEKLRVRSEISKQAEAENERGTWIALPELVAAYRAQKKPA